MSCIRLRHWELGRRLSRILTSYLKRLAQAHHLKMADLVMFCSTQTETHVLPSTLQKLSRIDGMTASAQAWSALLHDLTGREEVICLTMNYWRALLNPSRILRQHHAWCPLCFAQAARHETQPYDAVMAVCGVEVVQFTSVSWRKNVRTVPASLPHFRTEPWWVIAQSASTGLAVE